MCTSSRHAGFTLLELLVVIGIIGALASIVIAAINPIRQLGSSRDAKRLSDVNTIINAVYQYTIDHQGVVPPGIPQGNTPRGICKVTAVSCNNGVDLRLLSGSYLVSVPVDPRAPESGTGTMYYIYQNTNSRFTVTAPLAEDETITVTR